KDAVTPRRKPTVSATQGDVPSAASADPAPSEVVSVETDGLAPVPGASFAEVGVTEVVANRRQPRQVFDEDELEELASSSRAVGVHQSFVVRLLPDGEGGRYALIMSERRWRATQLAGRETVPAIIRHVEDNVLLRDALLENLHRAELNPLEEAAAYQQL